MKRFPSIPRLDDAETDVFIAEDDTIYVLEKLDGANFRWTPHVDEHGEPHILAGSRRTEFKRDGEPLPLDETNKQFRHTIKYIQSQIDSNTLKNIVDEYGDLVFFGESLHTHTVQYDWDGKAPEIEDDTFPNFIGFDIWSEDNQEWLSHEQVTEIYTKLNLPTTPVIHTTTVGEITDGHLEIPQSKYRTPDEDADKEFNQKGLAEGIVIKNDTRRNRAKKVSPYMEEVKQFGQPKDEETIEELKERKRNAKKFTEMFVTNQRILKNAHKLVDEGEYEELHMGMMECLPEAVLKDIFTEEGWNFLNNKYDITFTEASKEEIRQRASKRCARILQEVIDSPD